MAFDEMRSASAKPAARQAPRDPTQAQHVRIENVSRSFHAHREPQQSTRFGPPRNNSFSRSKDGTILTRLPARGGACAPPAATLLRLTPMCCRTNSRPPYASDRSTANSAASLLSRRCLSRICSSCAIRVTCCSSLRSGRPLGIPLE